jgi:hypothetical protein
MAITGTKQFPFSALTPFNALAPEIGRTEDKTLRWAGHPAEIHVIINNSSTVDYNLTTTLKRVAGGLVYNLTDDTNMTSVVITPLSTNPAVAVLTGTLTASKNFIVFVYGNKG